MTQTIEQLTAKVAELEEENTALVKTIQRDTLTSLRQLAALKADNESLKLDAEQWRAYQKRKQDLLDRGFLRSPLREEAELNPAMAQGENGC